ncbi:MAG: heparinase II/III family protein [Planctomycetota bacterium]
MFHDARRFGSAAVLVAILSLGALVMAQPFKVKHPTHDPKLTQADASRLEKAVQRVLVMSEEDLLALVPVQTAIHFCGCPNCDAGMQESNQLTWTIDRSREVKCQFCGHVYPSEKYPMDKTQTATNPRGEKVTVRYYLDKEGNDYFFEGATWRFQKIWLVTQCHNLARAYHVTRRPEYARRAALILNRFAELYPGYCVVKQWPFRRREYTSINKPPYPSSGGKWGRWCHDEIPRTLPLAYDLIYESEELDKLSKERGVDVRKRIEDDFFRATVTYMFSFKDHGSNMAPSYAAPMIQIGRCIGEPEYVHWAYHWVGQILNTRFFYDGMWCEAPSYHYQTVGGIQRVLDELKGYSDPPGYTGKDGLHFEDLDPEKEVPFLRKCLTAPEAIAYPGGLICPVHDTWAGSKRGPKRKESTCAILPGYGHAVLGAGKGDGQIQAHLHFSGSYGHTHMDNLNLALFAYGREMLCDIGYSHTRMRHWTICTIGHNLVAIDRKDQSQKESDGDLLMYVPNLPGLAVVEASGERGYPDLAQVYRRMVMLVSAEGAAPYAVDIFHVKGGQTHDWLLHGAADNDQTLDCTVNLAPREGTLLEPGETWEEPRGESSHFIPYGLMRNVRAGRADGGWSAAFRYKDDPDLGCRVHMLANPGAEVFACETPSIRRAGSDDSKLPNYMMPQLVVRRRGDAPLETIFVSVVEPYRGAPRITRVEGLKIESGSPLTVAIRVHMTDRTDTILVNPDVPDATCMAGGVLLQGRIGFLACRGDKIAAACLVAGSRLKSGQLELTAQTPVLTGVIESAMRKVDGADADAFVTAADLPEGKDLHGSWMIVTHGNGYRHGYGIDRIEKRNGKTIIHLLDDHGLRMNGDETTEAYFPRRTIKGKNQFVINGVAIMKSAP